MPYLHEQAHVGIRAGLPLMRAMVLEAPDDPRVWDYPLQFFAGSDLLVAPITEPGAEEIEAYLPDGDWIDLGTGARHGPGPTRRPTPLTEVAVFVRAAAWHRFEAVHRALRAA